LTGKSPNPGVKDDDVRTDSPEGADSYVLADVEHDGQSVELKRALQGCESTLRVGSECVRGEKEINKRLAEVLGREVTQFERFAFVPQGEISLFLMLPPTQRAHYYQELFGLERFDRAYKALGDHLTECPVVSHEGTIGNLEAELADLAKTIASCDAAIAELGDVPTRDAAEAAAASVRAYDRWRDQYSDAAQARAAAEAKLTELQSKLADLQLAAEKCEEQLRDASAAQSYHDLAAEHRRYCDVEQGFIAIAGANSKLSAALHALQYAAPWRPDVVPEESDTDDGIAVMAAEKAHALESANQLVKLFRTEGAAACPTCGTPVENLHDAVAAAEASIPGLQADIQVITEYAKARLKHAKAVQDKRQEFSVSCHDLQVAKRDLEQTPKPDRPLPATPPPSGAPIGPVAVTMLNNARRAVEITAAGINFQTQEFEKWQATLNSLTQPMTESDYARALQVTEAAAQLGRLAEIQGRRSYAADASANVVQKLEGFRTKQAEAQVAMKWRAVVDSARAAVHTSATPQALLQNRFDEMIAETNVVLDAFDVPFRVEAGQSFGLIAVFSGRATIDAARLSGGQKTLLSLARVVALNALEAGSIGFLGLDEPTIFLDDPSRGCLETAVMRLQELSADRNLQCLLVTHVAGLERFADQCITL
jgi:DNA repair exonuclease SbcCD ATPase subunit